MKENCVVLEKRIHAICDLIAECIHVNKVDKYEATTALIALVINTSRKAGADKQIFLSQMDKFWESLK